MSARDEVNRDDNYLDVERIENNLIYIKNHPYPIKGVPTVELVEKANEIKKAIKTFNIANIRLPRAYLGSFAKEIQKLAYRLTSDPTKAYAIAFVLEYDQAYRFRLQDLFTATTKEKLKNPLEILRLRKLHKQRDKGNHVHRKLNLFFIALFFYAMLPRWRKAIAQADFSRLQFDEGDLYWAAQKTDYDYRGKRRD